MNVVAVSVPDLSRLQFALTTLYHFVVGDIEWITDTRTSKPAATNVERLMARNRFTTRGTFFDV